MTGGLVLTPTRYTLARPFIFMTLEQENELLLDIVKRLASINAYEYPYRIPPLQDMADKLLLRLEFEAKRTLEQEGA